MNRVPCLCPDYTYVESFGPEDENKEEKEVLYMMLDLDNVDSSLISSSQMYRLILCPLFHILDCQLK